ncbi:putative deacylase [Clostridium pascui]|uniref:succinylglutamate desuccinylase/aspartoacylase domain-containing protein n=1 Tax=Clostridium pascui TaxID=46609 RepID=UPI00195B03E6|nr:succinylglutamate desuccinylase/aspartoacylase family protein [Clostridium pascui]MBM7870679.1 putative deacylase [Clostridium pascui]
MKKLMSMEKDKLIKTKIIIIFIIILGLYINPTRNKSVAIMKDTKLETNCEIINSGKRGPTLFIISGIHGNEVAGVHALENYNFNLNKGRVIFIQKGSIEAFTQRVRYPYYLQDLNRCFPGVKGGRETERLAYDIFNVIRKYRPNLVLDLHEAEEYGEYSINVANSLIMNNISSDYSLLIKVLEELNNSSLEAEFTFENSSPTGSINKEVSERLGIPVITVETDMKRPLQERINIHNEVIKILLNYYGMEK